MGVNSWSIKVLLAPVKLLRLNVQIKYTSWLIIIVIYEQTLCLGFNIDV